MVAVHLANGASGCHGLWRTPLSELLQCGSASIIGWLSDQTRWLGSTIPTPGEMTLADLRIDLAALAVLPALVWGDLALLMLLMGWCGDLADTIGAKFRI
jgi:hypothetical protein